MPGASGRGLVASAPLDLGIDEDGFWGLFPFRHHSIPMLSFWLSFSSLLFCSLTRDFYNLNIKHTY